MVCLCFLFSTTSFESRYAEAFLGHRKRARARLCVCVSQAMYIEN